MGTSETAITAEIVNSSDTAVYPADQENERLSIGKIVQEGEKLCSLEKGSPAGTLLPRKEVEGSPQSGVEKERN